MRTIDEKIDEASNDGGDHRYRKSGKGYNAGMLGLKIA
jgi:hypothetical protein